ncbi:MAG TPA: MBL fold metallo-hydrolase [Woeseiaceae bacterium]|nr:MBL fold metallo-hydrolase [Woeseiaceae bacterium]
MSERTARTLDLGDGITAIDTDYVRPMLDASHLLVDGDRAAFVDTGTNHSVGFLMEALESRELDPAQVQYVFLTHVHLDHAGGAGELMSRLPAARAVLHPRGAPHMIDPAKLIKGSQAVYGEELYTQIYGDIKPISAERIIVVEDGQRFDLGQRELQIVFTEGHARHHYCLSDPASRGVFTGDSFGISYRDFDTAAGEFIFPTTTPVHFDPPEAHKAIDRIMSLEPQRLYLTHYSEVTDLPRLADDMHRRIDAFVAIAKRHADEGDRTRVMRAAMFEYLRAELAQHGFRADDQQLHELLDVDVELNTMGLEHWLDRGK